MPVRLVVAVTDRDWFDHLRRTPALAEINFWSPSPKPFRALQEGELFAFKLHAPVNMIVGYGIFALARVMPLQLAWEAFGPANGASSLSEMRDRILRYRHLDLGSRESVEIGCRILTQPVFLPEERWIAPPASFSPNIVSFRGYSSDEPDGLMLWERLLAAGEDTPRMPGLYEPASRYGEPTLIRPRLGQGAFRLLITDSYSRRCAITGERTLPALEAAHIKPYADGGEHAGSNGILMRRDLHSLFDAGYVTVTTSHRFEVSQRIREEFENGRHYYALHGTKIALPDKVELRPDASALSWHNEHRYLG
jgi:putative restriction endonuclease